MTTNDLQNKVRETFETHFGYTPLGERLKDIQNEFFELMKWQDVKNLKEETGDLLASLIQLCNENEWDVETLIEENTKKIKSRELQYKTLGRKVKVAIFGGAFNPITKAHIQLAQFVLNTSGEFDEVWLMPAYKHMYNKEMVSAEDRLQMCKLAVRTDSRIKVFDYEIKNQLAGETFNLFKRLRQEEELNKKYNFSMIIGLDNANSFDKWVNYEELERMVRFVVVPRKGVERDEKVNWYLQKPHIFLNKEADIIECSSTLVREKLNEYYVNHMSDDIHTLTPYVNMEVLEYILEKKLYKK
jgi:nicotinate-nucleotide adenylyltransferase